MKKLHFSEGALRKKGRVGPGTDLNGLRAGQYDSERCQDSNDQRMNIFRLVSTKLI
jgi:hypothetical protein